MPWHAPHFACAPEASFQAGTAAGSGRFAPWQATFVHWPPFQTGSAPARRRESREGDVNGPVEMDRIEDRRGHHVAARARERYGQGRVLVRGVRGRGGPRTGARPVARPAQAAAIAEIDHAVHVKRARRSARYRWHWPPHGSRCRGPCSGPPAASRWQSLHPTGDAASRPRDVRLRAAQGVAGDGAGAGRAVVARLPVDQRRIERHLDDAVAVQPADDRRAGHRVARRARETPRALRRRLDVRRVSAADVPGEEARIARRVRLVSRAVARRAREHAAGLVVAARARRSARGRLGHACRARRGAVVASAARVRIAGIEHRRPARRSEERPVKPGRARIDDARIVHAGLHTRAPRPRPTTRRCSARRRSSRPTMRRDVERGKHGRPVVGRKRRRRARRRDAGDRAQERRRAPSAAGFVSPWQETQWA